MDPVKDQTKNIPPALIESTIRALNADPGASLAEIAKRAGVGRATLHRHFGSRDGLIRALTLSSIRETDAAVAHISLEQSAGDYLKAMLEALIPLGDRFHFLSQEWSAMKEPDIAVELKRQMDELGQLVVALKAEGLIAPDVPDAWGVAVLDSMIYTAWASVHEGWIARREAPALVLRTILSGLGKPELD